MVMSLISPAILPICPMRLSSDCTLLAERSTTLRIDWVFSRALLITASMACFMSSAVIDACWISPSCSSTNCSMLRIASATEVEVLHASLLCTSICALVCPTLCEALITSPTMPSRLSMKLLIQRPMSPVSSFAKRLRSRRWLRLPPPSAMVRITPVISPMRRANLRGPKAANSRLNSTSRPRLSRSSTLCSSPL
ncbi:hypothetical protein D3C81_1454020 [compost metagenome]